ncbi:Serine/threonine-protein phosphatase 2A 55 kDa regulatory subunit B alpha isoform [Saguinus oedipus]|uniref:Serine/threonine-protein phosphatase 2A 55 kDa regulatory subunit B alpha isoform n=1 Tax=Saguinus oedipus TaxID=9490 RepID=A0ABQ9UC59_SAGOE|nr:Serine/threonine-protein phosphatase 2A 55 kDa regulatory subunit B alpha isoform [Saguinus oedipus]
MDLIGNKAVCNSGLVNKIQSHSRGEYNVYSTFQSHEPEFDYLKSLEIEEKINKIRWLPQKNAAQFLLSTNENVRLTYKTIKLWKISERDKRPEGYNLKEEDGRYRDPTTVTTLRPANMEELTEVITAAEFHPNSCNTFVYSSSKGTIRLCDMRASALCDRHSKLFEEPEDPSNRQPLLLIHVHYIREENEEVHSLEQDMDLLNNFPNFTAVHEYLRSKLCSLYENDCIFDKFECCWNGSDRHQEGRKEREEGKKE